MGRMVRLASAVVLATIAIGCGGGAADNSVPAATTSTDISLNDINVVDLTVAEAEAKLKAAGWRPSGDAYGLVGGEYKLVPENPDWIICSQDFSTLVNGRRDLYLDAAPDCGTVRIPNLVGKTITEAEQQADALGLLLDDESSSGKGNIETDWIVCEQDPPPGPAKRLEIDYWWVSVEPRC